MPDTEKVVVGALRSLLRRRKNEHTDITIDADLYGDLQLDSLETAEFSAILEDDLGRDPYTEGVVPQTVAEVIDFYGQ